MRVKRFIGPTMQDAMIRVKLDMGKDAVIIHTRKFKEGGFLGLFGRPMIEVTAAVEEKQSQPQRAVQAEPHPAVSPLPVPMASPHKTENTALQFVPNPPANQAAGAEKMAVQKELTEMRNLMEKMSEQLDFARGVEGFPPVLQKFYQNLISNEVDEQLAIKLLNSLLKNLSPEDIASEEQVAQSLQKRLERMLKKPKPILFSKGLGNRQIVALVGPTGVGKTTTIAKLAAAFSIVDKRKVALITADTYRIAAVEQLKTFGQIIGVAVDVVYTPQELKDAISKNTDKELILIDTAGRSHKNSTQMAELKDFIASAEPSDIFLVLSLTTKSNDMVEIVESYSDIPVSKLVFTKLDETSSCGAILNVINKTKKALSYITAGQSVPDDLEIANNEKLANLMTRER